MLQALRTSPPPLHARCRQAASCLWIRLRTGCHTLRRCRRTTAHTTRSLENHPCVLTAVPWGAPRGVHPSLHHAPVHGVFAPAAHVWVAKAQQLARICGGQLWWPHGCSYLCVVSASVACGVLAWLHLWLLPLSLILSVFPPSPLLPCGVSGTVDVTWCTIQGTPV